MKKYVRLLALLCLLPVLLLTACSGEDTFQVLFCAPYANEDAVAEYGAAMTLSRPTPVKYGSYSFSSGDVDAMNYSASAIKVMGMLLAEEVDVFVCDLGNAARYANSNAFYDLTEIFTEEELEPYRDRLVSYELVDANGDPTGERTPVCGIDISGKEALSRLLSGDQYGIFIVGNTGDLELAKEVFWKIVNS